MGLCPVSHHKEDRVDSHLFIAVLAYQAVQVLRRKLNLQGIDDGRLSLWEIFSGQQRMTALFTQKAGRTLHVCKTTVAEQELQTLYGALGLSASPIGTKKLVH